MNYDTTIILDMSGEQRIPPVPAKQGDKDTRYIFAQLYAHDQPYTIPTGATARVALTKPRGQCVLNDAEISGANTVKITLSEQMLIDAGDAHAEVMLFYGETMLSSAVFDISIQPSAYNRNTVESSSEYQTFIDALSEVEEAIEDADTATAAANQAAANATTQANYAESQGDYAQQQGTFAQQQGNAAEDAAEAANSAASAANTAATAANTAANRANDAAEQIEGLDVSALQTDLNEHIADKSNPHDVTAAQAGAAPTYHATSVSTYGPGTNSSYGHVRLSGSASGADYAMSVSAKSTVSALNTTTYSYAGVYFIQINSSTTGTTGIEGLTTSYVYATLTTLPPPNTTGSASSGRSYEQILSIPKLQKTYHRYNYVTTTTYGTWKEILDSDFQFDLEDIGAAPKSHASSATTYGAGTGTNYGHVRLTGNGGSSDYAMTVSSKSTVSTLNTTTYSHAGIYLIQINSSTTGTTGIEGLTTSYIYATLTVLPPRKITGAASSGYAYEQILSIPKLQKTYHRYNYVSGSTYGTWKEIIDSDAVSYKSGDILTLSTYYVAGFITSSTEKFYFTMPLGKEIKSKNVLITGGSVAIRQNGNYIVGSASKKAEIDVDVMVSATVVGDNLNCELQNMGLVKFTDATNNDVAAAQFAKLEIHFLT